MVPSPLESDVRVAEEKTKNQVCECGGKELLKKKKKVGERQNCPIGGKVWHI